VNAQQQPYPIPYELALLEKDEKNNPLTTTTPFHKITKKGYIQIFLALVRLYDKFDM
jgi:hypothetical protein